MSISPAPATPKKKIRLKNHTILRIPIGATNKKIQPTNKTKDTPNPTQPPPEKPSTAQPASKWTQIYAKHKKLPAPPPAKVALQTQLAKWPGGIGKFVYKQLTKPPKLWIAQSFALICDLLVGPLAGLSPAKARANNYLNMGLGMVALALFIFFGLHGQIPGLSSHSGFLARTKTAVLMSWIVTWAPYILAYAGLALSLASFRYKMRRSYISWITAKLRHIPAFDTGIEFWLGEKKTGVRLSLKDLHTGINIFGSTGSGKTQSIMNPLLEQIFSQLNLPEPTEQEKRDPTFRESPDFNAWKDDPRQKVGGLILDRKGDFVDFVIYTMLRNGRPMTDLIIIDPEIELWRYNLLDATLPKTIYAQYNSVRLAEMQKIDAAKSGGGNDKFWDEASRDTVAMLLHILVILKPRHTIGLHHLARLVLKDELCQDYCNQAEEKTKARYRNNEIGLDEYNADMEAITAVQNKWIKGEAEKIKPTLKLTVSQLLGEFAANPKLQRIFCQNTNFDFKRVINEGKIVLFRGGNTPIATSKKICVALKTDFQDMMTRRAGSAAEGAGLQNTRSVVFYVDEFQEFVSPKDSEYFAISRSAKNIPVVATQGVTSYKKAFAGNDIETLNLLQNITTTVFLKTLDKSTAEYGEQLAGEFEEYKEGESISSAGLLDQTLQAAQGNAKSPEVSLSRDYKRHFRRDDFMLLSTQDGDCSATGPYYSEAIIFNYHERDAGRKKGKVYKTRLRHIYDIDKKYNHDFKKGIVARNTLAFNQIMYDRISQITTHSLFYPKINDAMLRDSTARDNFLAAIESRKQTETRARNTEAQKEQAKAERHQLYDDSLPQTLQPLYQNTENTSTTNTGLIPLEDYELKTYHEAPPELLEALKEIYETELQSIRAGTATYLLNQPAAEIDRILDIMETEQRRIGIEINRRTLSKATQVITKAFASHPFLLFKAKPRTLEAERVTSDRLSNQNSDKKYANVPQAAVQIVKAKTGIDLKEKLSIELDPSKAATRSTFSDEFTL